MHTYLEMSVLAYISIFEGVQEKNVFFPQDSTAFCYIALASTELLLVVQKMPIKPIEVNVHVHFEL